MDEKKRFKLILLTSCAIHFSFILFFPSLGVSSKFLPEYLEVSLIKPQPKSVSKPIARKVTPVKKPATQPVKKKVVSAAKKREEPASVKLTSPAKKETVSPKKVTTEPSKVAPVVKKSVKPASPKVSPVEIPAQPPQKLPALPPRVVTESKIKIPLVEQSLSPTIGEGISGLHPSVEEKNIGQGERRLPTGEKRTEEKGGFTQGIDLPSKAISPVKGKIFYEKGIGENIEGGGEGRIKGPLGRRRIERQVEPDYPGWAERQGIKGRVEVKCWVLPSGEVSEVEVWRTSGWPGLDECASRALMKWRFERIKEEEKQWGIVTFKFEYK